MNPRKSDQPQANRNTVTLCNFDIPILYKKPDHGQK